MVSKEKLSTQLAIIRKVGRLELPDDLVNLLLELVQIPWAVAPEP